ncbi:hypothetical protein SAMN05660657_02962 [Geodermatophilus amargosae]|uniref:Uncharacterized protein n=1 Tax=Geodermatophilus amargosae TaxID=1296565 RepID=A0A1I7AQH9_9ACTN|nr:hypothetical protein [Geodermatophilus amargosae]SFT77158.1 hypothetical protein SAMN05660657_02962 [Geodermatophilus amargosae]
MSEGADWLDQARRLVTGLGQAWAESGAGAAAGHAGAEHVPGGDCQWCPLCRAATVARRPEVSEALADLLTSAAVALRTVATPSEAPGRPEEPPPPAQVQHIELG